MPAVRRSRTLPATPDELWQVIGDPHHLPRWWPRVTRVEGVDDDAFTEVLVGARGKAVRADFRLVEQQAGRKVVWAQEIDGTPFARVLRAAETQIEVLAAQNEAGAPADTPASGSVPGERADAKAGAQPETVVAIELRQTLRGFLARLGTPLVRRAASTTIEQALDGLERIFAR